MKKLLTLILILFLVNQPPIKTRAEQRLQLANSARIETGYVDSLDLVINQYDSLLRDTKEKIKIIKKQQKQLDNE